MQTLALSIIAVATTFVNVARADTYCQVYPGDTAAVPSGSVATYLRITNAAADDTRATYMYNSSGPLGYWGYTVDLKGYLFRPAISFYAPVIVYSHGGTEAAKPPCAMVRYFVNRGYVFFAPQRRGELPSTGVNIDDWTAATGESNVAYSTIQAADVLSAAVWARTLPSVAAGRVALMGHSNGGIISMVANRKVGSGPFYFSPHHAVVDISGGGLGWCDNAEKQASLIDSVLQALRPVFFLQAANEPCEPTSVLDDLATYVGLTHRAKIYPPVPNATGEEAHNWFVKDPVQIAKWAPDAINFLQAN